MKVRSVIPMRIAKTGYIVISVVLLSLGILFIILPDISMRTIGKMLEQSWFCLAVSSLQAIFQGLVPFGVSI